MALGATPARAGHFVLNYCGKLAGAGLLFGIVLAFGALQFTASQIDLAVNLFDASAYVLSLTAIAAVIVLSSLMPTWRACKVAPQEALRGD